MAHVVADSCPGGVYVDRQMRGLCCAWHSWHRVRNQNLVDQCLYRKNGHCPEWRIESISQPFATPNLLSIK